MRILTPAFYDVQCGRWHSSSPYQLYRKICVIFHIAEFFLQQSITVKEYVHKYINFSLKYLLMSSNFRDKEFGWNLFLFPRLAPQFHFL
jgi:hypothetical protein